MTAASLRSGPCGPVQIRPRQPSDRPALQRLADDVHRADDYPVYVATTPVDFLLWGDCIRAWVAEQEERLVGHVALHRSSSSADVLAMAEAATGLAGTDLVVVARLVVCPTLRGAGLGRALLETALAEARTAGQRAVLDVVAGTVPAERLYARSGWKLIGTITLELPDGSRVAEHVYLSPEPDSTGA